MAPVIVVFGSAGEAVTRAAAITGAVVIDATDDPEQRVDDAAAQADDGPVVVVAAGDVPAAARREWPVFAADAAPAQLVRRIVWEIEDEPVLKRAWQTFATYDMHAISLRRSFVLFQRWILGLGILATFLALLADAIQGGADPTSFPEHVLHWAVVAAPAIVAVLIAVAAGLKVGKRWVLLRAGAESVKAEIYRYRTRPERDPVDLAARLKAIDSRLMQTEASDGDLTEYDGLLPPGIYGAEGEDDGLSRLDADTYLRIRVGDQLSYYRGKVKSLERLRTWLQVAGIAAGSAGAVLAAVGEEVWIGLTTAITGATLSYLGALQVDASIVTYNQSVAQLKALLDEWAALKQSRWDTLTPEEQATKFEESVAAAESVLTTELGGWVQQMSAALEEQGKKDD